MTEKARKKYPLTQTGYTRDIKKFVKQLANTPMLVATDEECEALYRTVFGKQQPKHSQYIHVATDQIQVSDLMGISIVSRATTDFAMFIRTLGNMDWVTAGHKAYHGKTDGKCPYCQGSLPADFDEKLAACYDEQYKKDLGELKKFLDSYHRDMMIAKQAVETNSESFPDENLADIKSRRSFSCCHST